jgi:hypothetical protein
MGALSSVEIAQLNRRGGEFAANHRAGVQVVVACPFAERIEHHMPTGVARESQRAALLKERLEAQLVGGFSEIGIHGNELLLLYRDNNVTKA